MSADIHARPAASRAAGIVLIVVAVATAALLINHPAASGTSFTDVLRNEAAAQAMNAVVHGGFIVVLAAELACMAIASTRLGWQRPAVAVAFVFALVGAGFLMLSMLVDGLVTPALAARYVDTPEKAEQARSVFVLLGTLVRFLMPLGLLFQLASVAAWSSALVRSGGVVRAAAIVGLVVAALAAVGIAATAAMGPRALVAALIGIAIWYALIGAGLALRRI